MEWDKDLKAYLIGNAHIDPVWLWRWFEGFAEIKATFRSALDRIKEFPGFIFTSASALYYKWIEDNEPGMFEEIKKRVKEGRWAIVGGWWVQPDCNMPSGESFVRQGLYGQKYFQSRFGKIARVGYNVDSFGHNAMIPQIIKKCGMDYYICMRPLLSENNKATPEGLFWWESMDGSKILAFKISDSYSSFQNWDLSNSLLEKMVKKSFRNAVRQGASQMVFYGIGNHGGGATISLLKEIEFLKTRPEFKTILMSSPEKYFNDVEKQLKVKKTFKGELQHSGSGCYSTMSKIKYLNRKAENRLLTAEKMASIARILTGFEYPKQNFDRAWENIMFNQFHDVLCGCSIKDAYEDAEEMYGEALSLSAKSLNSAVQKISWSIDTSKQNPIKDIKKKNWLTWETEECGTPLIVFNPLSWEVTTVIQINREVSGVTDEEGRPLDIQKMTRPYLNGLGKYKCLFIAKLPPMGYRVFWTYSKKYFKTGSKRKFLKIEDNIIENSFMILEIDKTNGYIKKYIDKYDNRNILKDLGAVPLVIDIDHCDTWAHGIFSFRKEIGKFSDAEIKVIENGPIRSKIRVKNRFSNSTLQQDFAVYNYKPDIEVSARLDWRERNKMLKLSFPVNIENPRSTSEIPYGHIARPVNGEEEPGLNWVDLSGLIDGKNYGLSILNNCKYGYDIKENDIRITVVNSSYYADHTGVRNEICEVMDQGIQEFKYVIAPHRKKWQDSSIVKKAFQLNTQFIQIPETFHEGKLPQKLQGIRISCENVIATVFKKSEDKEGFIIRLYETSGLETEAEIDILILKRKWKTNFGRCEIKTFFIPEDITKNIIETDLIEEKNNHKNLDYNRIE